MQLHVQELKLKREEVDRSFDVQRVLLEEREGGQMFRRQQMQHAPEPFKWSCQVGPDRSRTIDQQVGRIIALRKGKPMDGWMSRRSDVAGCVLDQLEMARSAMRVSAG